MMFGVVQAHRTSHLLEPHHYRDSCRVLSHEFGVVRLYRTFSIYIVTPRTRFAGCLCTMMHTFGVVQAHEPVRGGSNLLEPHHYKELVHRVTLHYRTSVSPVTRSDVAQRRFGMVEPPRTQFCHMSSGWFDCTEPSLSTSLQGQQGIGATRYRGQQGIGVDRYIRAKRFWGYQALLPLATTTQTIQRGGNELIIRGLVLLVL